MLRFYGVSILIHGCVLLMVVFGFKKTQMLTSQPLMLELLAFSAHESRVARQEKISRKVKPQKAEIKNEISKKVAVDKMDDRRGTDDEDIKEIKPSGLGSSTNTFVSYEQELQSFIAQNRFYPRKALALEQTGTVTLRLKINAQGDFVDVKLEENSGFPILDNAALELLKKLKSFKPLPQSYVGRSDFIIPIRYQMTR